MINGNNIHWKWTCLISFKYRDPASIPSLNNLFYYKWNRTKQNIQFS